MEPSTTPAHWLDRREHFRDNPSYPEPIERKFERMEPTTVGKLYSGKVMVVSFDPGGTTGWSMMQVDPVKLMDPTIPVAAGVVDRWWHGEIDCGSMSGAVGSSAQVTGHDLGISEAGENAGVHLCEALIGEAMEITGVGSVVVVIEDFILRTQTKGRDALSPVRLTAALEYLLWETKTTQVYKQQPSEAKTTVTDDRLKKWGFYDRGSRHARDADRHALLFLRKIRSSRSKVYKAWPILGAMNAKGYDIFDVK